MLNFYTQMITLHNSTDPAERITPRHDWSLEDYQLLTAWCAEGYLHLQNETPEHDWGYIINRDYYDSGIGQPWYFDPAYINDGFMLNTPNDPYRGQHRRIMPNDYLERIDNCPWDFWSQNDEGINADNEERYTEGITPDADLPFGLTWAAIHALRAANN